MLTNQAEIIVYNGFCPDSECRTKLFFPSYAASSIECTGCGKHYNKDSLHQVQLIKDPEEALRNLLRSVLLTRSSLKKGTDLVKVKGYSNYHCRLLSPLLTHYGMDNKTSKAKLLGELGQGDVFDCSHVGDRAFSIEQEYLDTPGYGRDKSGSINYLHEICEAIKLVNNNEERLVPLHVDGDGHCLVHAISRALIGREIFWHPLMINLQNHLKENLAEYKNLFMDFIGQDEWDLIISEAGPDYQPPDDQPLGLRNIHIFGLANVLHRPILLLDSVSGIQSSADYSGTFLPALVPVHKCKKKDGKLTPPIAIAWSNSGRNHYIPLVNTRNMPATKIPSWVIPKAWGIPAELVKAYIDFDQDDVCTIGGSRTMSDAYLHRLMKAMDDKFFENNGVSPSLVTEVHQFIFKPSGLVGVLPKTVIERTRQSVEGKCLMKCIACQAVSESECPINQEWLAPGGKMYVSAAHIENGLSSGQTYSFPEQNVVCLYDADNDVLKPIKYQSVDLTTCSLCKGSLRTVKADGTPIYVNGDRTNNPVSGETKCMCGFKHFWDGKEYNNLPEVFPVTLEWGGQSIRETIYWFQHESDQSLNSNVYAVAGKLVQKHFPGEFGSERLVQKVVDTILRQTARKEGDNKGARPDIPNLPPSTSRPEGAESFIPSKIILTGQKKKTFHKEELTQSDTERRVKIKTEHHASVIQHRQTKLQKSPEKSPTKQQTNKPSTTSLPSPTPTSPRLPRTDKKIRLSSSSGGQHDLTLPLDVTFSQLQDAIHRELSVPPDRQKIRYGFPPRLLHPPEEGKEQDPIPIQHGDRVTVEVLPPPEPVPQAQADVEMSEEKKMDVAGAMGGEDKDNTEKNIEEKKQETSMDVDFDTSALASVFMSALSGTLPNDLWEAACRAPQMFERGGYYYNLVTNDLGPLIDDQHFAIPHLPNKVFAYNKDKDRLELCLGKVHKPVQPLNQETLSLAHSQQIRTSTSTSQQSSSIMSTEASFSGVIGRSSGRTQKAFSGEGRSLSDSSPVSPRQPDEQQQQASLLASDRISEALKTLETTTSDSLAPVSSTASNPTAEEQTNLEEPTDKPSRQSAPDIDMAGGQPTADVISDVKETSRHGNDSKTDVDMTSDQPAAVVKETSRHGNDPKSDVDMTNDQPSADVKTVIIETSRHGSDPKTDVDMASDQLKEADGKEVAMETCHHGDDPKSEYEQLKLDKDRERVEGVSGASKTSGAVSDGNVGEGGMDVERLDRIQDQSTQSTNPSEVHQDASSENPILSDSLNVEKGNPISSKTKSNGNEDDSCSKEVQCVEQEEKENIAENVIEDETIQ